MSGQQGSRTAVRGARGFALIGAVALAVSAYGLGTGVAEAKAKPKAVVATATVAGVGKVLVDAQGKTLYDLTNAGQAVPCTGVCATAWPPLTLPAGEKLIVAKGVTGVKLNPARQVTAGGLPVYRFVGDTAAKQAHGEGVSSFGGTWHVAKATGAKTTKATPTTSGGSGSSGY